MQEKGIPVWTILFAVWAVFIAQALWAATHYAQPLSYSEFLQRVDKRQVDNVVVTERHVSGELKVDGSVKPFITTRVEQRDLADRLAAKGIKFSGATENTFFRDLLSWVVPALVFFGFWMFFLSRATDKEGMMGGMMSIGKSKARVYVEEELRITFADVAGVDEAKEELQEVVNFLKEPERYRKLGGRMPKGVLLVGPPGTGKTLLAKAVAGEAGAPFFSISGSEFVEMFVGVGAARVRDMFEQAGKKTPCIIFIDELDALGKARSISPMAGGHDEKEQTLNQLLVELDGFDPRQGMVVLAATNRPEILDPALLRAGRFDRQVLVDRPDKIGRLAILQVHMKQVVASDDVDLEAVAGATPGFTGADIANLVNEAALLAARRGAERVAMLDFNEAIERLVAGLQKKNRLLLEEERRRVAYHEMGHAMLALILPGCDPVHKVSIIPRGSAALGYTMQRPTEDRFLMSRDELDHRLVVLLGGRAAEMIVFSQPSTGAADDIARATDIARSMVTRYGMAEHLGLVSYETESGGYLQKPIMSLVEQRSYSESTARQIDFEVRRIVDGAYARALSILTDRRETLENAARSLLEKETLNRDELEKLVGVPVRKVGRALADIVPIENPEQKAV